jgi:hypothetical protein
VEELLLMVVLKVVVERALAWAARRAGMTAPPPGALVRVAVSWAGVLVEFQALQAPAGALGSTP